MIDITRRPRRPLLFATGLAAGLAVILMTAASSSQSQNYQTSWIGNSFGGTPLQLPQGTVPAHVQNDIMGMVVSPDGLCYTNSIWDEAGQEAGIYSDGQVVGSCQNLHGWGRNGASAIALDDNYVYVAITQNGDDGGNTSNNANGLPKTPPVNCISYCVRRYNRKGAPAPFPTGTGYDGSMLQVNMGRRTDGYAPYSGHNVSGIAVDGTFLYASDPTANLIKKYSLATLSSTPVSTWPLAAPGAMVLAPVSGGNCLCVIQGGATPKVAVYKLSTGNVIGVITFAGGVKPAALAFATMKGVPTLLVVDQGPDQNIKKYNLTNINLTNINGVPTNIDSAVGMVGGIYAGTGDQIGAAGLLRFNNPTGVGVDSKGNIYISQDGTCISGGSGGAVLESYTPGGSLRWQLLGLEFVDCADADPGSENDVYTKEEHFAMNYAVAGPGTEASYKGYTINRFKYPQDPRLHIAQQGFESAAWVRRYQGHKFLITTDMYTHYLVISRFNAATDGECAIPSTVFLTSSPNTTPDGKQSPNVSADGSGWPFNQPNIGEWIWRDSNGNGAAEAGEYAQKSDHMDAPPNCWGWWVDSNLDVWEATTDSGIRHFVCQGLDAEGNPKYDYAHMMKVPAPSQIANPQRIEYYPATDTMYLSGFSADHPNKTGDWGTIGTVICRYDGWSKNPALHAGYPIVPPYNPDKSNNLAGYFEASSLSVAGQYLFVSYSTKNQILVYNTNTGKQVDTILPGASIGGHGPGAPNPWTDIRYGVRAYQRANGEYLIFNEDDLLAKVIMYRWRPAAQTTRNSAAHVNR